MDMIPFRLWFRDLLRSFRAIRRERREYVAYAFSLLVGLTLCFAALYGFIEITDELMEGNVAAFDDAVARFVFDHRTDTRTAILRVVTELGDAAAYIVFLLATAVYFYFRRHNWILSIQIALVLGSTALINIILKTIIDRDRPAGEHLVAVSAQSFPSGHSMSSIAFYGFLIYLAWNYLPHRWMKITATVVLTLLIGLIGLSRIYLGVHYPSDVAAGFTGGLFWLVFCILAFQTLRLYTKKRKKRTERVVQMEE